MGALIEQHAPCAIRARKMKPGDGRPTEATAFCPLDRDTLANGSALEKLSDMPQRRKRPPRVVDAQTRSRPLGLIDHGLRFNRRRRQRLFAEYMDALRQKGHRDPIMQRRWSRDDGRID